MALRAKLELRFSEVVHAEQLYYFIQSLELSDEFRLAGFTFLDGEYGEWVDYSDVRKLEIHDAQIGESADREGQFWTFSDLTCKFEGDREIVETASRIVELAREYFTPVKHPVLPF